MAVVGTAAELPDSPSGSFDLQKNSFTRMFRVLVNSYSDGPLIVTSAIGIPGLFSTYATLNESHPYARVRSLDCERMAENSLYWIVTAYYETPDVERANETAAEFTSPLAELPEVQTTFETTQVPILKIYNVETEEIEPLQNSAGEVFPPEKNPTRDESLLILTITRNEAITSPHPALSVLYQNAVNSTVFWNSPVGTVKCTSIQAQRQTRQLPDGTIFPYLKVTYSFKFKDNWDIQLLDHGNYYIDNDEKIPFQDQAGNPILGLLDGAGANLGAEADPEFLTIRPYKRLNFNSLNLPNSFLEAR